MRRLITTIAVVVALIGLAGVAQALPYGLTIDPVPFTVGSASGSISLLGGEQGQGQPGGSILLTGGTAGDTLIFRVTMVSGVLDEIGVGAFPPPTSAVGSGWTSGAGVDVLVGPTNTAFTRSFGFAGGGLSAGQTSDAFFVIFQSGLAAGTSINFSLVSGASAQTFSSVTTLVPEPSTALLVLIGCFGLGVRSRQ